MIIELIIRNIFKPRKGEIFVKQSKRNLNQNPVGVI